MEASLHPSEIPYWRAIGASVTGTSHTKSGRGCEDTHACLQLKDGTWLLAAADGAGSAARAAEGASWATRAALKTASDWLVNHGPPPTDHHWYTLLLATFHSARTALSLLAQPSLTASDGSGHRVGSAGAQTPDQPAVSENGAPLRQVATTLLVAIVSPGWVATMQVGDGVVVIQRVDGSVEALTKPDHGEYINEATFLTDADSVHSVQFAAQPSDGIRGVALLTDGLQMLALQLSTNTPHQPFFAPLFTFAAQSEAAPANLEQELAAFLNSDRVCSHTDDDKTLVLAVRLD